MVSRRAKGSKRRALAKLRLAKAHERVANLRANQLHQLSSQLVKRYGVIVLEDLNVKGLAGGMLAGTIADLGFAEFRRQVEYKSEAAGTNVIFADRFFPSSKSCSRCGEIKDDLALSDRTFRCGGCGLEVGRDHNAGINLEKLGQSMPEATRGETGGSSSRKGRGAGRRTANARH
jgi:putative transposase